MGDNIADQLAGTWKSVDSSPENYDEFMTAMGVPKEKVEEMRKLKTTVEHVKAGDGWKTTMKAGEWTNTVNWKFNEEYETTTMLGHKTKSTPRLEGNTIVERHVINTDKGERITDMKTKISGNKLEMTFTTNGKSMTQVMVRQ